MVSTHSRPKAAAKLATAEIQAFKVSTHSRPKAAAKDYESDEFSLSSFNTQPPEGGCIYGFSH